MLRKALIILLAAVLCVSCAACKDAPVILDPGGEVITPSQGGSEVISGSTTKVELPAGQLSPDPEEYFTGRDLAGTWENPVSVTLADGASTAGGAAAVSGNDIVITDEGTYLFTGKLSDGQIRVEAGDSDKVQLVLSGVDISCTGSAAICVLSANKVFVTLAEGTENILTSTGEFEASSYKVDGAVFSKTDIAFNGTGSLKVSCQTGHGIVGKDDLKITGGSYEVTSAKQGISGNDSIRIAGGTVKVTSGTDAMQTKNDEDAGKGYFFMSGGQLELKSGGDGIDASGEILITGGSLTVLTGEGSASVTHSDNNWGGWWNDGGSAADTSTSCKALKAGSLLTVIGGTFRLDSQEDALHSNGHIALNGGSFTIAAGDDAIHADEQLVIQSGELNITKSYEGLEGTYITVGGGVISMVSSDDGINAGGGNDGSGMAGPWGGGFEAATDAYIHICGGTLIMNAGGDGIDSNGDLTVSGGAVYLDGPTNGGNGALDYAGEGKVTGGIVIALGSVGMASNFGSSSTQGAILCSVSSNAPAGTLVSVADESGKVLASYTSQKQFQSVLISVPGMVKGGTYTVSAGSASTEVTLTTIVYGSSGGPGGPGGRPGGPGGHGGRP